MKRYIATPINARQEPTMREKLISAKHRVEMLKEAEEADKSKKSVK